MKIAEGIEVLSLPAQLANGPGHIHPVLFHDAGDVILADAGLPGMTQLFQNAFREAGVEFNRLEKIVITHSDMDHIGGIAGIIKTLGRTVDVWSHALEKPYIQAEREPLRMEQMKVQFENLPEERRAQMMPLYESLRDNYMKLKADVAHEIQDGETIPVCGGITLLHTPGHTPGHVCLYHAGSRTLIAGDCFNKTPDGILVSSPERLTIDPEAQRNTLKKLAGYDIQTVVCYHGGVYENAGARIRELAGM